MPELIFTVAVLYAVVTLVGHGLWLLTAWLARLCSGASPSRPPARRPGAPAARHPPGSRASAREELRTTARRIAWLEEVGLLERESARRAREAIERGRRRLAGAEPSAWTPAGATGATGAEAEASPATGEGATAGEVDSIEPPATAREEPGKIASGGKPQQRPRSPAPVSHPLARRVLSSFLRENNIRQGEILGALLVIFSAGALVINFWSTIAQYPWLRLGCFTAVTGSVFLAGLYTERYWRLPTTSRSLLVLASLLVPLEALALIAFAHGSAESTFVSRLGVPLATIALWPLCRFAGRIVGSPWPNAFTLAVMLPSVAMAAVAELATVDATETAALAIALSVSLSQLLTTGVGLRRTRAWRHTGRLKAQALLVLVLAAGFSHAMAIALLAHRLAPRGDIVEGAARVSLAIALWGLPLAVAGGLLARRVRSRKLVGYAVAGTSATAAGALSFLVGLALAIPHPARMEAVAVAGALALGALAWRARADLAAAPAALLFLLAWALGRALWTGELPPLDADPRQLLEVLVSATTGRALVLPALLLLAAGARALAADRPRFAIALFAGGAAGALASTLLLLGPSLGRSGDPLGLTWIAALWSAISFAAAFRARALPAWRGPLFWAALAWLLISLYQLSTGALPGPWRPVHPLLFTLLGAASVGLGAERLLARATDSATARFRLSIEHATVVTSGAAAIGLAAALLTSDADSLWAMMLWLALVLLAAGLRDDDARLRWWGQLVLTLSVALFAAARASPGDDLLTAFGWSSPPELWSIAIPVAILDLLALLLRAERKPLRSRERWAPRFPADAVASLVLVALLAGRIGTELYRGLAREAGLDRGALTGLDLASEPALAGVGAWSLWLLLVAWFALRYLRRPRPVRLASLILVAELAVLLASAAALAGAHASTALGLSLAAFALLVSIALWCRDRWLHPFTHPRLSGRAGATLGRAARATLLWGSGVPLLAWAAVVFAEILHHGGSALAEGARTFGAELPPALPLLVAAATIAGDAVRERTRPGLLAAALAVGLASAVGYAAGTGPPPVSSLPFALELAARVGAALALSGLVILPVDSWLAAARSPPSSTPGGPEVLTALSGALALALALGGLALDALGEPARTGELALLVATIAPLLLAGACAALRRQLAGALWLHLLSLVALAHGLDRLDWPAWKLASGAVVLLGLHAALGATFWRSRGLARRFLSGAEPGPGPSPALERFDRFLERFALWSATAGALAAVPIVLWLAPAPPAISPAAARLARSLAAGALLLHSAAFLAVGGSPLRDASRLASPRFAILALVLAGWAAIEPGGPADLAEHRGAIALVVSAFSAAALARTGASARLGSSPWRDSLRRASAAATLAFAATLIATLALEARGVHDAPAATIATAAIVATLLAIAMAIATALSAALRPRGHPWASRERQRMGWVWAAEALLVAMFLHARFTAPWLFGGIFRRWWPFAIVAIAFLGVGLGALFRRRGLRVLAEPLGQTGVFLPVLPVIGYWVVDSRAEYSLVLILTGLLYGALSLARKSFGFGLAAALAANGGLWHFFSERAGVGLLEHPQLWLIPPAASVLLAARLHREKLSPSARAAIRYGSLVVVYLSSTADILVAGLAAGPWLPLLLALWSALGVAAGIALRARSFLLSGGTFFAVSLLALVGYASAAHGLTWLWYVVGIAAGLATMLLFALFEKKRLELRGALERFKRWEE